MKMYVMAKKIHEMHESKDGAVFNLLKELEMQPYKTAKAKALNQMNLEIASIISGKTKDELMVKGKAVQPKWKKYLGLAVPVLIVFRWLYTKYGSSEDG